MNLDQSADSEEEATENTRLMSETVAMENRAYSSDGSHGSPLGSRQGGSHRGDSRRSDSSQPAVIVPSTETVSRCLGSVVICSIGYYY